MSPSLSLYHPILRKLALTACLAFALLGRPAKGEIDTYFFSVDTTTGFNNVGPSGGTVNSFFESLVTPENRFNMPMTVSAIRSLNTGVNYEWQDYDYSDNPYPFGVWMPAPANLYDDLPLPNTQPKEMIFAGINITQNRMGWLNAQVAAGNLLPVLEFDITLEALSPNVTVYVDNLFAYSLFSYSASETVNLGYFTRFVDQEGNPYSVSALWPQPGETLTLQIIPLVGSDGSEAIAWLVDGIYEAEVIPEPGTVALLVTAGAVLALRHRRTQP